MPNHETDNSATYKPIWRRIVDGIRGLLGIEPKRITTEMRLAVRQLAKDAVKESGAFEFLDEYAATKDPEKRLQLKENWEERIAARKKELLGADTLDRN